MRRATPALISPSWTGCGACRCLSFCCRLLSCSSCCFRLWLLFSLVFSPCAGSHSVARPWLALSLLRGSVDDCIARTRLVRVWRCASAGPGGLSRLPSWLGFQVGPWPVVVSSVAPVCCLQPTGSTRPVHRKASSGCPSGSPRLVLSFWLGAGLCLTPLRCTMTGSLLWFCPCRLSLFLLGLQGLPWISASLSFVCRLCFVSFWHRRAQPSYGIMGGALSATVHGPSSW